MDYSLQSYVKKLPTYVLEQELTQRIAKGATAEEDFVITILENELKQRKNADIEE